MNRDIEREMEADEMYVDAEPTAQPRDDETREPLENGNSRARVLPCA